MDEKDLQIQDLKKQLAAAIEDIPHIGRLCSRLDKYGCCTIDNRYCHRQAHTVCPHWEWRGESGN